MLPSVGSPWILSADSLQLTIKAQGGMPAGNLVVALLKLFNVDPYASFWVSLLPPRLVLVLQVPLLAPLLPPALLPPAAFFRAVAGKECPEVHVCAAIGLL